MTLRVPVIQVLHEAFAVRLWRVVLGVRRVRVAEDAPSRRPPAEVVGVVDRMAGLMTQDAQAPGGLTALDLEHLRELQPGEPRVREIERDGDAWDAVGGEPLVG